MSLDSVRGRNESAWLLPDPTTQIRTPWQLREKMRRFGDDDEVDLVIVGCGAGGGVLAQRLSRRGWRVVVLDAGPFWDPDRDWVSDELGSHHLYWTEPRQIGGSDPVPLGANNSGRGVGGSTIHYAGYTPRFHPSDFRTRSLDGVGADWPIRYEELRRYYQLIEEELPVAGQDWPWGDPHRYPHAAHPVSGGGEIFLRGCRRAGIKARVGPVAITNAVMGNRPHCIYRGFCIQGCKVGAKQSTLYSHVPDAIHHGAEIRANCMVARINVGKDGSDGGPLVTGVTYFDGEGREQEQRAKVVIVSGYAIETPRLLLNSSCAEFPTGLGNSSDAVGRYLMVQAGNVVMGRFAEPIRMYKVPPANGLTEEFYETDPKRDFARGFAIQTVGPLPIGFAKQMMVAKGAWGWGLRQVMMDYNHWAAFGLLGELLPWADNRVTLAEEQDRHGLRVAKVTNSLKDNDKKLIAFGARKTMEVMWAAGAEEVVQEPRYAHLIGGARMGNDSRTSVVDSFGRSHDIPNLFCCDGSILPTQGSANPGLTIQAIAARTADYLISEREGVMHRHPRPRAAGAVPIRHDLAPAGTSGRGVPRNKG